MNLWNSLVCENAVHRSTLVDMYLHGIRSMRYTYQPKISLYILTDFPLLVAVAVVVAVVLVVVDATVPTVATSPGNEADDEGETVTGEDFSLLLLLFTGPHRSSGQMSSGMSSPIAFLAAFTSSSGVIAID